MWLSWQQCYHSNEVFGWCLLSQGISIPNINSIQLRTNKLLMFPSDCYGNLVTMRYVTVSIVSKDLHTKYELNTTKDKEVIEVSLWLPWQLNFQSNQVCSWCLLLQGTSIPNTHSIRLETNNLLLFPSGCHGNQVFIAMCYEADAYCHNEPSYQMWTEYGLRQRGYRRITMVAIVT